VVRLATFPSGGGTVGGDYVITLYPDGGDTLRGTFCVAQQP